MCKAVLVHLHMLAADAEFPHLWSHTLTVLQVLLGLPPQKLAAIDYAAPECSEHGDAVCCMALANDIGWPACGWEAGCGGAGQWAV